MATKSDTATHAAFLRGKKKGQKIDEQRALLVAAGIILLLLFLILAQLFGWWPYHKDRLGTAFYSATDTVLPLKETTGDDATSNSAAQSTDDSSSSAGTSSASGSNGTNGSNGASGNDGSNGSNGGGSTTTDDNALVDLAANIDMGDTFADISAKSSGLSPNCAALADISATIAGTQKVCVYTQGDKLVTVTYLNDKVISASKTGF
jgi:hypothetical protein